MTASRPATIGCPVGCISCGFDRSECSIKPRFIRHKLACCRGYDKQWIGVGAYSLHGLTLSERGKGATQSTADSFIKCSLFVPIILLFTPSMIFMWYGAGLAIICGAMTSCLGYVMCYQSLMWLKADTAATLQLTVPIITLFLGFILLSESISLTQAVCAAVILV